MAFYKIADAEAFTSTAGSSITNTLIANFIGDKEFEIELGIYGIIKIKFKDSNDWISTVDARLCSSEIPFFWFTKDEYHKFLKEVSETKEESVYTVLYKRQDSEWEVSCPYGDSFLTLEEAKEEAKNLSLYWPDEEVEVMIFKKFATAKKSVSVDFDLD